MSASLHLKVALCPCTRTFSLPAQIATWYDMHIASFSHFPLYSSFLKKRPRVYIKISFTVCTPFLQVRKHAIGNGEIEGGVDEEFQSQFSKI